MRDPELWAKIRDHDLDAATPSPTMASGLAAWKDWSMGHAQAVLREYKRFIYLAMVAETEVTPPEDVRLAWRLHKTYTRDYQDTMGAFLPRALTGDPSKSKIDASQYEATKTLYAQEFDEAPPASVWHHAKAKLYRRCAQVFGIGCFAASFLYPFSVEPGAVDADVMWTLWLVAVCVNIGIWIRFDAHGRRLRNDDEGNITMRWD